MKYEVISGKHLVVRCDHFREARHAANAYAMEHGCAAIVYKRGEGGALEDVYTVGVTYREESPCATK